MAREFAKSFYHSKQWAETRDYCLKRDKYLCVRCGKPAEEVHHIVHLSPKNIGDVNVTMNPDNLICLCRDCHFEIHEEDKRAGTQKYNASHKSDCNDDLIFDENGYLIKK